MKIFKDEMKKTDIITTLLCLIPFLIGIAVYSAMPEQMPIHFDVNNQPDNYAGKEIALFGLPAFLLLVHVICIVVMESDAKRSGTPRGLQILIRFLVPVLSIAVTLLMISSSMGYDIRIGQITTALVGLIMIVLGYNLPRCRHNYTVGIRLPWTLADEENWDATHRFAGPVWIVCGVLSLLGAASGSFGTTLVFLFFAVILPVIYSFRFNRKKEK